MTTAQAEPALQPGAERPDVDHVHAEGRRGLIPIDDAGLALRKAWAVYLLLGLLPPAGMIAAIFFMLFRGTDALERMAPQIVGSWGVPLTIAGQCWIGATLPIAFFVRARFWSDFRDGGVVAPKEYLKGWLAVWTPLVIGGVFGFVAFAITREPANLLTCALAFVIFMSMLPNGHAMTRPVGHEDDSAVYEEPK